VSVVIYYTLPGASMESITLDVAVVEQHSSRGEITDYPVETGSDVSDHKRVMPDRLHLEGVVSNTPLPSQVGSTLEQFQADMENGVYLFRGPSAYVDLLAIHRAGIAVTITTELRNYERMQLESLEVPTSAEVGDSVRFTADFKQIATVDSQTVKVTRTFKPPKTSKGDQPKKKADASQEAPNSMFRASDKAALNGAISKAFSGGGS
jgi:hypothetical protein